MMMSLLSLVINLKLFFCFNFIFVLLIYVYHNHNHFYLFCLIGWVLHLDSTYAVGDIHAFHARCNTFENMICNKR